MKTICTALALVVVLSIANTAGAAHGKKANKDAGIRYYQTIDQYLKPVTLTDDQKSKLDALKKDYESKFKDAYAKQDILKPEQKKAGEEAKKAAKADGKGRKEQDDAFATAAKVTDDQKSQIKEAGKQLRTLEKEVHGKVLDLLTAEQKAQIDAAKPKKGDKPAKSDATPATK